MASLMVTAVIITVPGAAAGFQSLARPGAISASGDPPVFLEIQPAWNTGNLCPGTVPNAAGNAVCVNLVSASSVPLWYNLSAGEVKGGTINVYIYGSDDCIYLNFHSFDSTINVVTYGSDYSCSATGGDPGLNIVVNSESDSFSLTQLGSGYSTDITVYGTTTQVSVGMAGSDDNTQVTYIGWSAETGTCPSGITGGGETGRVVLWDTVSFGSYNNFATVFVDGTNVAHPPPNYGPTTEALAPPDGMAYGTSDTYTNSTTQTTSPGDCYYLGE
ncbi:MAG: hypothetical protein WB947_04510 [Thermoplasmata archaeon]